MNALIVPCSPKISEALSVLNEQLQDGKIDAGTYNRKMLELQAQAEQDKNYPQICLTGKTGQGRIQESEIGEIQ